MITSSFDHAEPALRMPFSLKAGSFEKIIAWFNFTWVRCSILVLLGFAVRLPAMQGGLIWDDEYLARDNPFMKSPLLILEGFRHYLFPESFSAHYRPVQNISYCFDYFFWNTNPYGFHISSIAWHVASGVLLYLLCGRLFRQLKRHAPGTGAQGSSILSPEVASDAAFAVALLWVIHPVQSAAVDYISGRADSLAFFFACSAWLLYFRAQSARAAFCQGGLYSLAGISALLALCSRETALIWILLFFVYLFAFERKATRRGKVIALAICLAIVAAYAGLRQLPPAHAVATTSTSSPAPVRAVLMLRALGDYTRLMFFPGNLHMERTVEAPEALLANEGWRHGIRAEYLSILGLATAAALLWGACRRGPARAIRMFGAVWFVVAYLPISNLIELNATVAEHWLYLPSVGFLLFVVGCCLELPSRSRKFIAAAGCIAVLGLSARSFIRSGDWVSPEMFYRQTIGSGGDKIRVALNLSQILVEKGDYARAEPLLRKILALSPDYPVARNTLAHLFFLQGKKKEAEELFAAASKSAEDARKDYPRTWVAALNVAHMYCNEDNVPGALVVLDKARANYPGIWPLISFESELLRKTNGPDAALPLIEEFVRQTWWHSAASIALGRLYLEKGDLVRADAAFRHASWLDVHDALSVSLMASIRVKENRLEEACATQRRAVSRQPDEPRQYLILSSILTSMGRTEEAAATLAQVTRLQALAQVAPVAN